MKRYGNLYEQICSMDNLRKAHQNAKKGKGWYEEVKEVEADVDGYLTRLQEMLINHTYQTSKYEKFIKRENGKEREIFKLPYFPDRICQWAILQVIEPYLLRYMTKNTYSAIPDRGIHAALNDVRDAMQKDVPGCQYCLKLDVRKFYPSINHDILKQKFRRLFKDAELLWLLDEIIDSICTAKIEDMQTLFRSGNCTVAIKGNWQVFPSYVRGVDFVGYRTFLNYTLLRKSSCKKFKAKMVAIRKKTETGQMMNYSEWCSVNSYKGWLKHCDSYRLQKKYLAPIQPDADRYYLEVIKSKRKAA